MEVRQDPRKVPAVRVRVRVLVFNQQEANTNWPKEKAESSKVIDEENIGENEKEKIRANKEEANHDKTTSSRKKG